MLNLDISLLKSLQRLTALNASFRDLETRATSVSQSLAQIDASASNVSSTLNQLTSLGKVLRTLMVWKWPFILILLTSIYDRQWATLVAAFFCELISTAYPSKKLTINAVALYLVLDPSLPSILPNQMLIHYASGYQLGMRVLIKAVGVITLACLASFAVKATKHRLPTRSFGLPWSVPCKQMPV